MSRTKLIVFALLLTSTAMSQEPAVPSPAQVAHALGFTDAEIERIKGGEIIRKDLKENSDKELAGVVAVFFAQPVTNIVAVAMQGKLLETEEGLQAFHGWKPEESPNQAFAGVALDASEAAEAAVFARAAAGNKLNLSAADAALFQKVAPTPQAVSAQLRAMLQARYTAYRKRGLAGIAPYARAGNKESSPAEELRLAITETMAAAGRPNSFQPLLTYPREQLPDMEHRFYWFKQTVENRPAFILAHRAERHVANAALLTEEQFYVSHSYNSNFIAGGCLAVEGGTLVFYVNHTFTDQVAGLGSGLKHKIGRAQMLDDVTETLRRARKQLQ